MAARLFPARDRKRVAWISDLVYCNPFLPQRIELERAILGSAFDESKADWNVHPDWGEYRSNVDAITDIAEELARVARDRLAAGHEPSAADREQYEDLVLLCLYYRFRPEINAAAMAMAAGESCDLGSTWDRFRERAGHFLGCLRPPPVTRDVAQLFAFCIQFMRAFHQVFDCIIGASPAAIRLREQVWNSIFTHDTRRYRRLHFDRMGDYTTLITGPSGTGKELVARAIGVSRYIPFDPRRKQLVCDTAGLFYTLNLSALSSELVESELFGHKRGAFTGAFSDRKGWLEMCPERGAVFLDEMGEIDHAIQVKLLRVLEDRRFSRVGESKDRKFAGKIIAATNRDLALAMHESRFRTDLYYRLCGDTIETPSLCERICGNDEERHLLLLHLARREMAEGAEALVAEVERWIDAHLGPDYPWPGNVRELDQCLRNVLIRREYRPAVPRGRPAGGRDAFDELAEAMRSQELSADDVLRRYCTLVYERAGSLGRAARRLKLDRRTVRAKVAPE